MEKFNQKYRISSARLAHWDYGSPGLYFVTICTKNRDFYFGEITVETQNFASLNSAQPASVEPPSSNNTSEMQNMNTETQNINVETQNFASLNSEQRTSIEPADSNNITEMQNIDSETQDINVEAQNFASLNSAQGASVEPPGSNNTSEMQNMNTETQNINVETQNFSSLRATAIGNIANQYWLDIPKHFPFVELDEYVVMPNHVHGILFINKPDFQGWQPNKFGPQSQNLGSIIRGYKAGVKTFATMNQIEFGWQPRFHDHIIRSEKDLNNIRKYIISNPDKWYLDRYNPENLMM